MYEVVGYRFVRFNHPTTPRKLPNDSILDEKPFLERFQEKRYRSMLLQDIKLLFHLQKESSLELDKFLATIITSYRANLNGEEEVKAFQKIVENIIRTTQTPFGKQYFLINGDNVVFKN